MCYSAGSQVTVAVTVHQVENPEAERDEESPYVSVEREDAGRGVAPPGGRSTAFEHAGEEGDRDSDEEQEERIHSCFLRVVDVQRRDSQKKRGVDRGREIEEPSSNDERDRDRRNAEYYRWKPKHDLASAERSEEGENGVVERGMIIPRRGLDQLEEGSV